MLREAGHARQAKAKCWTLTVVESHRAYEEFPFYHFDHYFQ